MKKNIGILFPLSKSGGVFQYAQSIANCLINYCGKFNYKILHYQGEKPNLFFDKTKAQPEYISIPKASLFPLRKILHFSNLILGGKFFLVKNLEEELKNTKIDLLIVPTPFSFEIPLSTPFVASIPDYMHRYFPNFPEYSLKERKTRNIVYKYYAKRAILVVADSEQQINDLYKFSKIEKDKVRVIPYIPPAYIYYYKDMDKKTATEVLRNYQLPGKFIFYPGQFWFQKNHAGLIKALNLINKNHRIKIPLVLVGHSKGCSEYEKVYKEMMDLVKNFKMEDQIYYLGYTGEKEIVALYKKAVALIAPPFQGPTTIPPLEAIVLGTPVVTVNLFEIPKQVENAGIFFDPSDIEDMADKVYKIWTNEKLRQGLIKNGKRVAKNYTLEVFSKKWEEVIKEALKIYEKK